MKLSTWRKSKRMTLVEAGELLGTDHSTVARWESGERIPRKEQMQTVVSVTEGAVTPCSFYDVPCAVEGACQSYREAS